MTGPQHYAEAERLMTGVSEHIADDDPRRALWTAEAQVHATLALAAAAAYPAVRDYIGDEGGDSREWTEAVSR